MGSNPTSGTGLAGNGTGAIRRWGGIHRSYRPPPIVVTSRKGVGTTQRAGLHGVKWVVWSKGLEFSDVYPHAFRLGTPGHACDRTEQPYCGDDAWP